MTVLRVLCVVATLCGAMNSAAALSAEVAEQALRGLSWPDGAAPRERDASWMPVLITAPEELNNSDYADACGDVSYRVFVGMNGAVTKLELQADSSDWLRAAIERASRRWLFLPQLREGRPVEFTVSLKASMDCEAGEVLMLFTDDA